MYILKKLNVEKIVASEYEKNKLLQKGFVDITKKGDGNGNTETKTASRAGAGKQ